MLREGHGHSGVIWHGSVTSVKQLEKERFHQLFLSPENERVIF